MSNLLNTTTAEADARLVRHDKNMTENGATLTREWSHIDATVADTLKVALDAVASYSNPQADAQSYTGTFINSKVWAVAAFGDPENGERYVNILQSLILVTAPANISALAALEAVITQENEILLPFNLDPGEEDKIAYVYRNLNPSARTAMMGLADADLVSNLPGTGWTYVDRIFKEEDDGTATFSVLFMKETWASTTWAANRRHVGLSMVQGIYAKTKRLEARGFSKTLVAAQFAAMVAEVGSAWVTSTEYYYGDVAISTSTYLCIIPHTSGTFADDLSAGKWIVALPIIANKDWRVAASGEHILSADQRWEFSGTAEADAVVLSIGAKVGNREASSRRVWWRRTAAAKATLVAGSTFTGYTHESWDVRDNEDGTFDVYQTGVIPRSRITWEDTEDETLKEIKEVVVRVATGAPVRKVLQTWEDVFSSASAAADYADDSDAYLDEKNGVSVRLGYAAYIGNGKWKGVLQLLQDAAESDPHWPTEK